MVYEAQKVKKYGNYIKDPIMYLEPTAQDFIMKLLWAFRIFPQNAYI